MKAKYDDCLQTAPQLNLAEAWPASRFPDAEYRYFRDCGCLVCALTVLLRQSGLADAALDPWVLNRRLIACGAFTPAADLELEYVERLYPLVYLGAEPWSREGLCRAAEKGEPCLITLPGVHAENHFTALLCLTPDDALLFDPLYGEKRLSTCGRVCGIRRFRLYP